MKVEELILDGFKSYATRTVISGWDSSFNCITGFNGSGKSNILDAICFVLGITTMSTVRAQNLQDLIYKRGQAGVTKASVTIVFDNSDASKGPIGFEDQAKISVTRQIVLGGTSKFLINGHRAQQQTVQHLFQSVQLNINNPNFLIMQGRITKVLNMKSTETLALIEEAAGTRMFEERREKAIKTMSKKEKKVEEILELLQEEIEPKLENLRNEKRTFLDYQQTQSNLERMEKLVCAHDYIKFSANVESFEQQLNAKNLKLEDTEKAIEKSKNEIKHLEDEIETLRLQKEDQIQKGGRFQALEKKVKEISQELARLNTLIELKSLTISEEVSKKCDLENTITNLESQVSNGQEAFNNAKKNYDEAKKELEVLNDDISKREELLRSLQTGVSSKEGSEGGYANQLQEARNKMSQAQTRVGQAQVRVSHLQNLIAQDESKTAKAQSQVSQIRKDLENKNVEFERLKSAMEEEGWQRGKLENLKVKEKLLTEQIREMSKQLEVLKKKVSNIEFHYSKPSPSFNPSSVKGLVAQLFKLDKKNYNGATALEVCAGGRLFHVVVDTDASASELLQKGQLKRRVTIIPLNKIAANRLSVEKLNAAKVLSPGKVELALNLIAFEPSMMAAMEFVFGSTLICQDAESAKKVTFDPNVRTKSVTIQGDVYDPLGTLSGGSNNNSRDDILLITLQKYNELNTKITDLKAEFVDIQKEINLENDLMIRCKDIKRQMDLKEHEIKLATQELESGSSSTIISKLTERAAEIEQLKKQIVGDNKMVSSATEETKRIERDIAEFKNNKGDKLDQLKKSIEQSQAKVAKQSAVVKKKLDTFQKVQVESGQLGDDLTAYQELLKDKNTSIEELNSSMEHLHRQYTKTQKSEQDAIQTFENEKAALVGINDELKEFEQVLARKTKFVTESGLDCQKLKHDIEKTAKELGHYKALVKRLLEEHDWIEDQQQYFGKAGTAYAYQNVDIEQCRGELNRLKERIKTMKNNVNSKVMNMIENVEKKEASLKTMINTIEKDKRKIEETISTLDEYKREALVKTWEKVSADFGKIFSDLLPGGFAKLVAVEGKDISEGLEVKVALGKVWKEGLAELSGGQRSLIALSLILALLQFKPAPMYILDEVDAALDLHHTQNIGHIIKTRFKGSQFIVVSLKEGMFTNANRVFRARFHEGTSTVSVM